MSQKLIIIRGNSGSGKSTVAKKLQLKMGYRTMLIPQDVVRREILRVKDEGDNPSIDLISMLGLYGSEIGYDVIVEGILIKKRYGAMLERLMHEFNGEAYAYYLDIPFEETLRQHKSKDKSLEYGEKEMRSWWVEKDYLGAKNEKYISDDMNEDDIVELIYNEII